MSLHILCHYTTIIGRSEILLKQDAEPAAQGLVRPAYEDKPVEGSPSRRAEVDAGLGTRSAFPVLLEGC